MAQLHVLLMFCVFSVTHAYFANSTQCGASKTAVFTYFANITSSSLCEIKRFSYGHTRDETPVNTFLCYDNSNIMSEDCTARCITNALGGPYRGLDDNNRDICTGYNATAHQNKTCSQYTNSLLCHGDTNYCGYAVCNNTSTYNCFCKKGRLIEEEKVDCGHGWFTPLQVILGYSCIDKPHLIQIISSVRRLSRYDIIGITADVWSKEVIELVFVTSEVFQWGLIEELNYNKSSKDHEQVFTLVSYNSTGFESRLNLRPTERLEALFLLDEFGRFLLWNDELTKTVLLDDDSNVTTSDFCNRLQCDYCEGFPNYSWCKMAKFGWPKTIMVTFLVIVCLFASLWICAGTLAVLGFCKFCFCTPIKLIRYCSKKNGQFNNWMKKGKATVEDEEEETTFVFEDTVDSSWERKEDSQKKKKKKQNSKTDKSNSFRMEEMGAQNSQMRELQDRVENITVITSVAALESMLTDILDYTTVDSLTQMNKIRLKDLERQVRSSIDIKRRKLGLGGSNKPSGSMYAIAFLSILSLSNAQCTDGVLSTSNVKTCTVFNSTHEVCTFDPKIEVALTGAGNKLCLTFLDQNNSAVYAANVTFKSMEATVKLSNQYSTIDYTPNIYSKKSCFLQKCCNYHSIHSCEGFYNAGGPANPCSMFPDGLFTMPGHTGCRSYPGCAGNGCFSCAESCNYYRFYINPLGGAWNVSLPGLTEFESTFEFESPNVTVEFTTKSPQFENNILTAEIVGIFNDLQVTFGKSIVSRGGDAYYIDASPPNAPVKGLIGDVQANSELTFTQQPDAVAYDPLIDVFIVDSSGIRGEFGPSGMSRLESHGKKFPTEISGLSWYYDSSTHSVKSYINRRLSAILKITLKQPLTFYQKKTQTCPKVEGDALLSGCHDCSGGGMIIFKAKSTCYPGNCFLSSTDPLYSIVENEVSLTGTSLNYSTQVLTHEKDVHLTIKVSCGANFAYFNVSGTLSEDTDIYNNLGNETYQEEKHQNSDDFDLDGMDWLRDLLGLSKTWTIVVFGIVIFVFVVLLIGGVAFLIIRTRGNRLAQKMNISIGETRSEQLSNISGLNAVKSGVKSLKENPFKEKNQSDSDYSKL